MWVLGLVYIILGILEHFLMLYLQKEKNIDFEIIDEYIVLVLLLNIIAWPLILLIVWPIAISKHYLNKKKSFFD